MNPAIRQSLRICLAAIALAVSEIGIVGEIAARCATGCRKAAGGVGFRYRIAR
jgi:hypothetical protein